MKFTINGPTITKIAVEGQDDGQGVSVRMLAEDDRSAEWVYLGLSHDQARELHRKLGNVIADQRVAMSEAERS